VSDVGKVDSLSRSHPSDVPRSEKAGLAASPSRCDGALPRDDRVELSELGRLLSAAHDLPDIRVDKVAAVREQVESGSYVTDRKIDATVDRILTELI
jgi:anti-sigma28 factor (negative regulator of flagellin synthesis)